MFKANMSDTEILRWIEGNLFEIKFSRNPDTREALVMLFTDPADKQKCLVCQNIRQGVEWLCLNDKTAMPPS